MTRKKMNKKLKWTLWLTGGILVGFIIFFFGLSCMIILMAGGNKMIEDQNAKENCEGEEAITSTVNIQNSTDMSKNAKSIYQTLVQNGATPEGACAVLGVWQLESNLNPKAVNSSSGATGLAQWLGIRLTKLQTYASSKAKPHTDIGTQVEFALKEFDDPYYAQSKKALRSKDISSAVRTLVMNYEGLSQDASQQFLDQRTKYAQNWYGKFKGDKITSSIVSEASQGDNTVAQVDCDSGQSDEWRDEVIRVAKTQKDTKYFMGNPQRWGQKLDCSGFVQGVYERATGIKLGRTTIDQEKDFRTISKSEAQKGDVCFWGEKGKTHHIAIYDGDGGVYEMKDEKLNWQHTSLKNYYGGQPDFWGTLEGTKKGASLSSGTVGGNWTWPSPSRGSFSDEQDFGYSSFRQGNFHNGLDFGSAAWPSNKILACHGGTVVFAGDPGTVGIDNSYPNGLGKAVVVVQDGDMQFVYQEFGSSTSAIKVKKGQKVKAGQLLAIRDNAHMHLGITKKHWVEAEGHAFSNDGTWLDPQKLIQQGMNKK